MADDFIELEPQPKRQRIRAKTTELKKKLEELAKSKANTLVLFDYPERYLSSKEIDEICKREESIKEKKDLEFLKRNENQCLEILENVLCWRTQPQPPKPQPPKPQPSKPKPKPKNTQKQKPTPTKIPKNLLFNFKM